MQAKTELMMAFWPNANLREHWSPNDTYRSAWVYVRSVEIKYNDENMQIVGLDHWGADGKYVGDVALWLWGSEYGPSVELKAHDVHSASAHELKQLSAWLTKYTARIAKAEIPNSFGLREKLILTLRAMGIKRGIKIDSDWQSPTRFEIKPVEYYLDNLPAYAGPLAEMEALCRKKEEVEA
jgi:hypothetical protein